MADNSRHPPTSARAKTRGRGQFETIGLLLITFAAGSGINVEAAEQKHWTCVDSRGIRAAQDHPCAPGHQTLRAPAGVEAREQESATITAPAEQLRHPSNPETVGSREQSRALLKSQRANPFQSITDLVWRWAGWLVGILLAITAIKLLIGRKRRRKNPWHRAPEYRPPAATSRTIPTVSIGPTLHQQPFFPPAGDVVPARPAAWDLSLLRALEWKRFEELCERFWLLKGYPARLTSAGADGGVDVVIADQRDASKTFAVAQCKSWTSRPVGVEPVRALWGSRDHFQATLALFYGLSGFTDDAMAFASGKHLKLISGDELLRQIHSLPDADSSSLLAHVTRGDFTTPTCPACDIKMVRRKGKEGKADFWGCERFRTCGARPIPMRT